MSLCSISKCDSLLTTGQPSDWPAGKTCTQASICRAFPVPRTHWPLPMAVTPPPGLGSPPQRGPPITLPKSDPHLPQSFPHMSLAFSLRSSYHNLSLFLFFSLKTFLLKKKTKKQQPVTKTSALWREGPGLSCPLQHLSLCPPTS